MKTGMQLMWLAFPFLLAGIVVVTLIFGLYYLHNNSNRGEATSIILKEIPAKMPSLPKHNRIPFNKTINEITVAHDSIYQR